MEDLGTLLGNCVQLSLPFFSLLKIKTDFGFQPKDLKTTIIDMGYNLIDAGFIKKTAKYEEIKKQKSASE